MKRFVDKAVLVTGATSGIGVELAERFAQEGARLTLTGRNDESAAHLVSRLRAAGASVHLMLGELRDGAFCEKLVDDIARREGRIDVLVNNAGIIRRGRIDETTDEDWLDTMEVNVTSLFRISRAAVRAMKRASGGTIVNMGSVSGTVGGRNAVAYCASKGAVHQLTRAMAVDHARDGVRVNAVAPGGVDTPMLVSGYAAGTEPDRVRAERAEAMPLGRLILPRDVADAVLFLASDQARHVTGAILPVDGGFTAA